jgi:hypothetical protein
MWLVDPVCSSSFLLIIFYSLHIYFLVSLQEKLGDGIIEPRSLEDEGIFVGKKPVVPTNLVHRAEKRILQECAAENKVRKITNDLGGKVFSLF